tara:strand:- start:123 stop:479 length:357 start_codon:yes stop_codon:yes gene_type:complete
MEIDKKIIRKLVEALEDLKKSLKSEDIVSDDSQVEEEVEIAKAVIKSPIVGTAYLAPEPGAKPFVSVGKKIKKGDTVMIVEAMKTMNHVPSTSNGIIKKVCVDDGQPVEFGQIIVILE